jgi:hypothetical protein
MPVPRYTLLITNAYAKSVSELAHIMSVGLSFWRKCVLYMLLIINSWLLSCDFSNMPKY